MTLHQNFIAGSWIDGTEAAEASVLAMELMLEGLRARGRQSFTRRARREKKEAP